MHTHVTENTWKALGTQMVIHAHAANSGDIRSRHWTCLMLQASDSQPNCKLANFVDKFHYSKQEICKIQNGNQARILEWASTYPFYSGLSKE